MKKYSRNPKTRKLKRSLRILDSLSPGRRLKLMKLKKKIENGDYSTKRHLLEVFDEIIKDAKENEADWGFQFLSIRNLNYKCRHCSVKVSFVILDAAKWNERSEESSGSVAGQQSSHLHVTVFRWRRLALKIASLAQKFDVCCQFWAAMWNYSSSGRISPYKRLHNFLSTDTKISSLKSLQNHWK